MTIKEAISKADALNPNQYLDDIKVGWLSDLDYQIYFDVLCEHEPIPTDGFVPYTIEDLDKDLIVSDPFTEVYTAYLDMKVDEANKETSRYNNSVMFFNAKYEAFAKNYHKNHKPVFRTKFRLW